MYATQLESKRFLAPGINQCYLLHEHLGLFLTSGTLEHSAVASLYAPEVDYVSIVGDFNGWNSDENPLTLNIETGVWSGKISGVCDGQCYKFFLKKADNSWLKSDPFARAFELRPGDASIVTSRSNYEWKDQKWMCSRKRHSPVIDNRSPLLILEVHLSSWRKHHHEFLNYRELAHEIADYAIAMHYTHVEILPIAEHLVDESMGYQVTGYFAPTSRHGTQNGLKYFVDHLHQKGLGVILDWVPAHFSQDPAGLIHFTGQALFEPDQYSSRKNWGTQIFDFEKRWVKNFLISNALYWLSEFHFDGLRVDAVSAILYKDFLRDDDEWDACSSDSNINYAAVDFIKELNLACKRAAPEIIMIAEESTAWPDITSRVSDGGLGFDYAWNLGWINDTKRYFSLNDKNKKSHQKLISFAGIYLFNERYIHSLSHDELDPTTKGLYQLSPDTVPSAFKRTKAALFLFYLYLVPGAKLLLAGSDMGIMDSWNPLNPINYQKADTGFISFIRSLNLINKDVELAISNHDRNAFTWVDCFEQNDYCIAFIRQGKHKSFFIVINFSHEFINYQLNSITSPHQCLLSSLDRSFPARVNPSEFLSLPPYSGVVYVKDQTFQ